MVDAARGPLILETNTVPGLTRQSLFPQAAAAQGIEFPALVNLLIDEAMARHSARAHVDPLPEV